jgi:hypothetical protein
VSRSAGLRIRSGITSRFAQGTRVCGGRAKFRSTNVCLSKSGSYSQPVPKDARLLEGVDASNGYVGKFRGEPFAFGVGARSERVATIVDEAGRAAGVDLASLVDEIRYAQGNSGFDVVKGRRVLSIGSDAFGRTGTGQLMEALHEIGHAEYFAKRVRQMGWDRAEFESFWGGSFTFWMPDYLREEQVVERLARMRSRRYLGELSSQEASASTRYINRSRQEELRAIADQHR